MMTEPKSPTANRRTARAIVLEEKRAHGGWRGWTRRYGLYLGVVGAVLISSPLWQRALGSYDGIVLEVRADEMLLHRLGEPPVWVPRVAEPGDFVTKRPLVWTAAVRAETPADAPLVQQFARYHERFEAELVSVQPPVSQGAVAHVTYVLDDGERRAHDVFDVRWLKARAPGKVYKARRSWEPVPMSGGATVLVEPPAAQDR